MNRFIIMFMRKAWYAGKDFFSSPRQFIETIVNSHYSTDYERWSCNDNLQVGWDERTKMMAAFIPSGASVIEFGSGAQVLRNILPEGCSYQPYDLVARTPNTLVCDLNSWYPDIAGDADVTVFSGVLEYVHDLPGLFDWLHGSVKQIIFSYATYEHTPSLLERRKNGWVNDFTEDQILQLTNRTGFHGGAVTRWRGHVIFVVKSL